MRKLTVPDITFTTLAEDDKAEPCPTCKRSSVKTEEISAAKQLYRLVMFSQSLDGGFTVDAVRKRIPLGEKLDEANKTVLLEDAEYEILQAAFNAASWRSVSPNVIALADAVEGVETVEVEIGKSV